MVVCIPQNTTIVSAFVQSTRIAWYKLHSKPSSSEGVKADKKSSNFFPHRILTTPTIECIHKYVFVNMTDGNELLNYKSIQHTTSSHQVHIIKNWFFFKQKFSSNLNTFIKIHYNKNNKKYTYIVHYRRVWSGFVSFNYIFI